MFFRKATILFLSICSSHIIMAMKSDCRWQPCAQINADYSRALIKWMDNYVALWDLQNNKNLGIYYHKGERDQTVIFSPDGKLFAIQTQTAIPATSDAITLYASVDGTQKNSLSLLYIETFSFCPNNSDLIIIGTNKEHTFKKEFYVFALQSLKKISLSRKHFLSQNQQYTATALPRVINPQEVFFALSSINNAKERKYSIVSCNVKNESQEPIKLFEQIDNEVHIYPKTLMAPQRKIAVIHKNKNTFNIVSLDNQKSNTISLAKNEELLTCHFSPAAHYLAYTTKQDSFICDRKDYLAPFYAHKHTIIDLHGNRKELLWEQEVRTPTPDIRIIHPVSNLQGCQPYVVYLASKHLLHIEKLRTKKVVKTIESQVPIDGLDCSVDGETLVLYCNNEPDVYKHLLNKHFLAESTLIYMAQDKKLTDLTILTHNNY